jgi:hypothetical protein
MPGRGDNVVRLGCAEQAAIAEELRQYWQHVVDEGVPDHLRGLIARFPGEGDRIKPSSIEAAHHQHRVEPAEGE